MMKGLMILSALLFLGGCAEMQTLEQLEMMAATTGDWSAVEKRERRLARTAPMCSSGYIEVCQSFAGTQRCSCASAEDLRAMWLD